MGANVFPAIEIGGSHVSTARVDLDARQIVPGTHRRMPLNSNGTVDEIIGEIAACARRSVGPEREAWGVAIPGGFDFDRGIGSFAGAGKFEALDGVPLRPLLGRAIEPTPLDIAFVNDADAFLLGEWLGGAASGERLAVGITLGTGIGSAFVEDGAIVDDDPRVPPQGRVDLLTIDGRPLEDTISHRAIVARYAARADEAPPATGVDEIATRARTGQPAAVETLDGAFEALGRTLAPWLRRFGAEVLVVGGGMMGAWDVIEPPLQRGLAAADADAGAAIAVMASTRI